MEASGEAISLDKFFDELEQHDLSPLWTQYRDLMPASPQPDSVPHLWRYSDLKQLLLRAGELVDHKDAIRRSLNLLNPGFEGRKVAAVGNLYAAIQLVLPGEVAPSHRHGAAALRLIIEGDGGYTAVNGERAIMRPGDLILTPSWAWHDHGNPTDEPMIWMDGLDMPLINALGTSFYEADTQDQQDLVASDDASVRAFAQPGLLPTWRGSTAAYSPLAKYPWETTERALLEAAEDTAGDPYDGVMYEYVDPTDGGPVMPTMACFAQLLAPGTATEAHRHTSSTVYHVVRGSGSTIMDGNRIDWDQHDIFVIPSWASHHHVNRNGEPAFLFSFSDRPVLEALDLYREQVA